MIKITDLSNPAITPLSPVAQAVIAGQIKVFHSNGNVLNPKEDGFVGYVEAHAPLNLFHWPKDEGWVN